MYSMIAWTCSSEYPRWVNAMGTVWFTIFINPPPTSFLYLTSAMSGSTPVAIHHEPDRPGRRQHGRLRVAIAMLLTEINRVVPGLRGGGV